MENIKESNRINANFLKGFDKIVGKDDLRAAMKCVRFKDGTAAATDANMMAKVDMELYGLDEEAKGWLNGYFADPAILAELKIGKDDFFTISPGAINVYKKGRANKLKTLQLLNADQIDGKYPNLEAVIPSESGPVEVLNFNAKLMVEIQDLYKWVFSCGGASVSRNEHLKDMRVILGGSPSRPLFLKSSCDLFLGLVMPMQINVL